MRRIIDGIGFALMLFGFAGIGGNVDLGRSVAVPVCVLVAGALILGATSMYEVIEDERKNNNRNSHSYRRNDARPYYLR